MQQTSPIPPSRSRKMQISALANLDTDCHSDDTEATAKSHSDNTMSPPTNSADRMRQLRERADALLQDPTGIPSAPDSTLLEAIPRAYRASLPATLGLLVAELIKRTNSDVTVTIPSVTVTTPQPPEPTPAHQDPEPTPAPEPTPEPTPKTKRGYFKYSPETKSQALKLWHAGTPTTEIAAWLESISGREEQSHITQTLQRWSGQL